MRATTSEKGILRPQATARRIDLRRYPPAPDVGRFVERYWAVHWDLRDHGPYEVTLVCHPCVNITFLAGLGAQVHGVGTRTSRHPLSGAGQVFGVKFRPGGCHAFLRRPLVALTDRSVPMREAFGPAADALAADVLAADCDHHRVALVERFLRARLPTASDPDYALLVRIITTMLEDRTITRVAHVADRFGLSVRALQRLFRRYVGVGPKWVIRRYRLHDAAALLADGQGGDAAALAVSLGWFDQAHFTRDFTALIGVPPREYAAACAQTPERVPAATLSP